MRARISLFCLLFGLFLTSCEGGKETENKQKQSQPDEGKGTVVITGNLTNTESNMVYLYELQNNRPEIIDSSSINKSDGSFKLSKKITSELDYVILSLEKSFPISLYLQASENPHITSSSPNLKEYEIEGSMHSEIVRDFLIQLFDFQDKRSVWVRKSQELPYDAKQQRQKYLDSVTLAKNQITEKAKSFIDNHSNSPASIIALGNLYPQGGLENFDTTLLTYFDKIESGMAQNFPNSIYHNQINQDLKMIRSQLAQLYKPKGQAGDISLEDPNGVTRSLSDLKGKVVLVDFWASWCGPCRRENPNLVRLYNEYKNKGFTVYSVSLDGLPQQRNPKQEWITAIQQDGLMWPDHVSDLQGWQSSVVSDFGVASIPYTLLIDKNGSVIAEGLRGPQLEQKLKEILK